MAFASMLPAACSYAPDPRRELTIAALGAVVGVLAVLIFLATKTEQLANDTLTSGDCPPQRQGVQRASTLRSLPTEVTPAQSRR